MKTLIALALAATSFAAIPAQAQSDAGPDQIVTFVPYGDLNLASAAGAQTLENRVKTVASRLCGVQQAPGLPEYLRVRSCREDVLDSARIQMNEALAFNGSGSVAIAASR